MSFRIPQITWEGSFANTLNFGYPLNSVVAESKDRQGSERVQFVSGIEDAFITGTDFHLRFEARWIPVTSGSTPAGNSISGWDEADGVDAFLQWARQTNQFRFIPDKDDAGTFILSTLVNASVDKDDAQGLHVVSMEIRNPNSAYLGY